jgi:hypothetical protein
MSKNLTRTPPGIALWVMLCAYLNCAGWILSAFHQLNAVGYSIVLLVGVVAGVIWWKRVKAANGSDFNISRFKSRFRRPFPLAFLILAAMAFLGGALYAPTNYDGLAYRLPRVLNWLAEGQWHWIHTDFHRLNVRAVGIEWISAPLLALTKSDRLLFLINIVSLVLLPGLVFSVFTRLGISRKAAWYWMWLFPAGYCFLLQAGSIGNDLFGALFALAALDFALRAKAFKSVGNLWLSCLAAALLTGGKTSNLPLLLPWAVAVLPSIPLLLRRPLATALVGVVAAVASFLPVAISNYMHCGDWSGQKAEQAVFGKGRPLLHVVHNGVLLGVQNFCPPVFPLAGAWNRAMLRAEPPTLRKTLEDNFEPGGAHLSVGEMQMEEEAGIGFGVSVLLLLTAVATWFSKSARQRRPAWRQGSYTFFILAAAWFSVLPYMVVSGSTTAARLVTPYYAYLVPIFLLWQSGDWISRNRWWRWMGMLQFAVAGLLLVISPPRPLWPANTVLSKINASGTLTKRALSVYGTYAKRPESFAPLLDKLPSDLHTVGLVSFDDPETSLWKPFGSRRILHVLGNETTADLRKRGLQYVLLNSEFLNSHSGITVDSWVSSHQAELVCLVPLALKASREPVTWAVVKIPATETKSL